jgi:hypothetical protein
VVWCVWWYTLVQANNFREEGGLISINKYKARESKECVAPSKNDAELAEETSEKRRNGS